MPAHADTSATYIFMHVKPVTLISHRPKQTDAESGHVYLHRHHRVCKHTHKQNKDHDRYSHMTHITHPPSPMALNFRGREIEAQGGERAHWKSPSKLGLSHSTSRCLEPSRCSPPLWLQLGWGTPSSRPRPGDNKQSAARAFPLAGLSSVSHPHSSGSVVGPRPHGLC